jgi:hypothetical protein
MAELLKRIHDLLVLKIELLDGGAGAAGVSLRWTLQGKVEGRLEDLTGGTAHGAFPQALAMLRGQMTGNEPPGPVLPRELAEEIGRAVHRASDGPQPLWVHLVKPYGALRLVPWERLLVPLLDVPVLMLPDFVFPPPPREALAVLDVAVCASAPLGVEDHDVRQALTATLRAIVHGSPRPTRLHLFCDAAMLDEQRALWQREGVDVAFGDPQRAEPYVAEDRGSRLVDRAGLIRSPWLLWMRDCLRERAVDVVHFVGHGLLSRGRGAMLFAQSPLERTDRYLSGPVGALELQTFLSQVGAWSTAFGAVRGNHSPAGLRALADEIAQARPGPLLMHDAEFDPHAADLAAAVRFLYAPLPGQPPTSPALLLYCQPYLVAGAAPIADDGPLRRVLPALARNPLQAEVAAAAARPGPLDDMLALSEAPPAWLAATRNFVDEQRLRLQSMARDQALPEGMLRERSALVNDTLQRLTEAVAGLARERGLDPVPPGTPGATS